MRFFKNYQNTDGKQNTQSQSKAKDGKKFGGFFAKIVCVFAAVLVWFYASGEQGTTYEKIFSGIDVQYEGLSSLESQGYTIISGNNASVEVTVSGKRANVNNVGKNEIIVSADVTGINAPGEYSLGLAAEIPGGTSVKGLMPDVVVVYVDKLTQKEIPVVPKAVSIGTTDLSIKIEELIPAYSTVRVTGPEEEISKISHAAIDVNIDRLLESSVEYPGQVYLVDKNGDKYFNAYVKTDKTEMKVSVPVKKYKTVPIEVAYSGDSAEMLGFSVKLSSESVEIRGNVDVIDSIESIKTKSVDLSGVTGNTSIVANLVIPSGVEIVGGSDTVSVTAEHSGDNTKTVTTTNLVLINVPKGYSARLEEDSKTFTFFGNQAGLSKLTGKNVHAVADLSAYTGRGTFDVKLSVYYPDLSGESGVKLKDDYYARITIYK